MESRKTPTSVEKRGKTSEHRKTPTGEKKKKEVAAISAVASDSEYLINKMFTSQAEAREEGDEYDVYAEAKSYERKHKSKSVIKPSASMGEPTSSVRRSLKVPKKEDDAGSETGTYTVQGEKDLKDIENARQSIDKVFGVDNHEYELEVDLPPIDNGLGISSSPEYSPPLEVGRQRTDSQDLDDMEDEINDQHDQVCS